MQVEQIIPDFGWPWGGISAAGATAATALGILGAAVWLRRMMAARRRRAAIWALRWGAIILLALYALQPLYNTRSPSEETKPISILIDRTASMDLPATQGGATRRELADKALKKLTAKLTGGAIAVQQVEFGGKGGVEGTDLAAAVEGATGDGAVLVMISDGGHNAAGDVAASALSLRSRGGVLHGIVVGDERLFDIAVGEVRVDRRTGLHTEVEVKAEIITRNAGDRELQAVITNMDGKVVAEKKLRATGAKTHVEFSFRPIGEGLKRYVLKVPVLEGELCPENNTVPLAFEVVNRKFKVLYMEGSQYRRPGQELWEHQFLEQALSEDPDVEVTPLLRDENKQAQAAGVHWVKHPAKGYPRSKRDLFSYDVIISSDIDIDYFSEDQLKWTVEFVEKHGGGFAMVGGWTAFGPGGYDNSIIDKMLPVDMLGRYEHYVENEEFHWNVTREALRHPIMTLDPDPVRNRFTWETMPAFFGHNRVERAKPAATVLATHPTDRNLYGPAVILAAQDFGNGRSLALTTDTTAGWGELFEDEWGEDGDNRYFRAFWKNALRWLAAYRINAPERHLELRPSKVTVHPGERLAVRILARDEEYAPTTGISGISLGLWPSGAGAPVQYDKLQWMEDEGALVSEIEAPAAGTYVLRAKGEVRNAGTVYDTVGIAVSEVDIERAYPGVKRDYIEKMARITGGKVVSELEAEKLAARLMEEPAYRVRVETHEPMHNWLVLLVAMGLLCTEWGLRKHWGTA